MPAEEREAAQGTLLSMKPNGIPDTIAYVTEEELSQAQGDLEQLGYERVLVDGARRASQPGLSALTFAFQAVRRVSRTRKET